jgi:dCTP deaminase
MLSVRLMFKSGPNVAVSMGCMILSGAAIRQAVQQGEIVLGAWSEQQLNPNSYNFRLADKLLHIADAGGFFPLPRWIELGPEGFVLEPRNLYLGATAEVIGSDRFAMTLLGRSSTGRLGLFLNVTADLGHTGSSSRWTLELSVVQSLRIYPGMQVGQVAFWRNAGSVALYGGRYQQDLEPTVCRDLLLEELAA